MSEATALPTELPLLPRFIKISHKKYKLPIRSLGAVHVLGPIANPVLLVEAGSLAAHVGHPPAFVIAQVEDHAFELLRYFVGNLKKKFY